jgi:hypothetical protein
MAQLHRYKFSKHQIFIFSRFVKKIIAKNNIVTCIPIARQRLGKQVATVNKPQQQRSCFLCDRRRYHCYAIVR